MRVADLQVKGVGEQLRRLPTQHFAVPVNAPILPDVTDRRLDLFG